MKESRLNWIFTGISGAGTVGSMVEVNVVLSSISAVVAILAGLISILYTIKKWYDRVTRKDSDGGKEITFKEILEGVEEVGKEVKKFKKEDDSDGGKGKR